MAAPAATPLERLELRQALELAGAHSPRLEAALHERRATEASLEREKPGLRPTVNLTASQALQGPKVTFPRLGETVTVVPTSRSQVGVTAQQMLVRFGASAAGGRYRALRDAAAATYEQARREFRLEVTQAYLKLAGARTMAGVAREGRELADAHVALVESLLQAQTATKAELLRAQADAAEARQGVLAAENGEALARANLERLLGAPLAASVDLVDAHSPNAADGPAQDATPGATLEELIGRGQARRPEVLALRSQLHAAEAGVSLARGQGLPSVQLDGALIRQTPTAFSPSTAWSAGITVTLPLLDGGKARSEATEARERVAQLRANLRELQEGIALEVRESWSAAEEARARGDVAAAAVKAAEEAHAIAVLRYRAGAALNAEVLDARLALTRARANQAQAGMDLLQARAELDSRSGSRDISLAGGL
ncbi:MAG TPA: TolC family protein [Armatimonadota bacterium]